LARTPQTVVDFGTGDQLARPLRGSEAALAAAVAAGGDAAALGRAHAAGLALRRPREDREAAVAAAAAAGDAKAAAAAWLAYADAEARSEDPRRAAAVLERAVAAHPGDEALWLRLEAEAGAPGARLGAAKRAVAALPASWRLREAAARAAERAGAPLAVLDACFAAAAAAGGAARAAAVGLARCAAERRRRDGAAAEAWALDLLAAPGADDAGAAAYAVRAYGAARLAADGDESRDRWRRLLDDPDLRRSPRAWRDAAASAVERGDLDEARRLHRVRAALAFEAARRRGAPPRAAADARAAAAAWLVFERDRGGLGDFDAALAKTDAWHRDLGPAPPPPPPPGKRARAAAADAGPARPAKRPAAPAAPAPAAPAPAAAAAAAPAAAAPAAPAAAAVPAAPAAAPAAPAPAAAAAPAPAPAAAPRSAGAERLARTAYVSRLRPDVDDAGCVAFFESRAGAVSAARVLRDKRSGAPKCAALVEFAAAAGLDAAVGLDARARGALAAPGGTIAVFRSKFLVPDAPPAPPPRKPRAPAAPLVPRAIRRPKQGRKPPKLAVAAAAPRPAAAEAAAAAPPATGLSNDAFRDLFHRGEDRA